MTKMKEEKTREKMREKKMKEKMMALRNEDMN